MSYWANVDRLNGKCWQAVYGAMSHGKLVMQASSLGKVKVGWQIAVILTELAVEAISTDVLPQVYRWDYIVDKLEG